MSFELELWTAATVAITALCIVLGRRIIGAASHRVLALQARGTSPWLTCTISHTLGRERARRLFRAIGCLVTRLIKKRKRWAAFGRLQQTATHKALFAGLVRRAGVLRRSVTYSTQDAR